MLAPYHGGCLCSAVRFVVEREPLTIYACHCTDCQRSSGSAFTMSMLVERAHFSVAKGEPTPYVVQLAAGKPATGFMCAACHTRLWRVGRTKPDLLILRPGTLDKTSWLEPAAHLWTRSAQPWFVLPEGPRIYETQPTGWEELIRLSESLRTAKGANAI